MRFSFDVMLRFSKYAPCLKGFSPFEDLRVTYFFRATEFFSTLLVSNRKIKFLIQYATQ
jgi:hypothetical protein